MTGISDGVSKLWILRRDHGLNIEGHDGEIEAIDSLIRHALMYGPPDTAAKIEAAVAHALKHLDEDLDEGPRSEP